MKRNFQLCLLAQLSLFVAIHAVGETVSLGSILAPVEWVVQPRAIEQESKVLERPVAAPAKPMMIEVKLDDVLGRLEAIVAHGLEASATLSLASRSRWTMLRVSNEVDWDVALSTPFTPDSSGRWYPSISILLDGEVVSNHRLIVEVALFRKVWMITQRMDRGSSLPKEMLEAVVRDVFSVRGQPILATENLRGYEFERSVSRGALLAWEDLRQQPHVRRNELVDVIAESSSMSVRMRGRCMEDGVIGDIVTVRNLDTNREFSAAVYELGTVKFEL
jgi:flagella basal body P-ring formation protein FlgA